jgi:hypothetical protein
VESLSPGSSEQIRSALEALTRSGGGPLEFEFAGQVDPNAAIEHIEALP